MKNFVQGSGIFLLRRLVFLGEAGAVAESGAARCGGSGPENKKKLRKVAQNLLHFINKGI